MKNHSFKVGDTVKLTGVFCGISSTDTGIVVGFGGYINVRWSGSLDKCLSCGLSYPHKPSEIEHAVKVGEQLLFSFMLEE